MVEAPPPKASAARSAGRFLAKALLTAGAFWLLFAHRVTEPDGRSATTFEVIRDFLPRIGLGTFARFVLLATATKALGVLASMLRWSVLLRGQGIDLPFRHVAGSFLIGRFLGTFLPSTIGLDGYKLYDAARFSGRSVEASGATLVEKVLGFTGIFLTFLVALPFGVSIFGERAGQVAALTVPVALLPVIACFLVFVWPGPPFVRWIAARLPGGAHSGFLDRLVDAVTAYRGKPGTIAAAAALSFVVHFTTAAMYFFTALAIGVTAEQASFWQVTFASTIQILATVLSPFTIAGEGIREIAQYYLLGHLMGPAESIVSAALGFWAAEALTLVGGVVWWLRGDGYRPAWCRVDGRQVDWDEAARESRDLGFVAAPAGSPEAPPPLSRRLGDGLVLGAAGGLLAGWLLGAGDAAVTVALSGAGEERQVLWFGVLLYGLVLAAIGAAAGAVLGLLPLSASSLRRATLPFAFAAAFLPLGLAVGVFRLQRDFWMEQRPPIPVLLLALAAGLLATAVAAWWLARPGGARRSPWARLARALALWLGTAGVGGAVAAATAPPPIAAPAARTDVPAVLRDRPNLVLVIVDTLRADHLGAYGDGRGLSPRIDAVARQGT
ncbi:MAG: lysylphosphatidylglycerol synthase domain-containing protein, partial [Alphaproteobacteria bacterium]